MADEVEIKILPETRVAYMRYVGPYGSPRIADLRNQFGFWCERQGLISPQRRMFGIARFRAGCAFRCGRNETTRVLPSKLSWSF